MRRGQHDLSRLSPSMAAGRRYGSMAGLQALDTSGPRIRSQGSRAALAMPSSREVLPFDKGPTM